MFKLVTMRTLTRLAAAAALLLTLPLMAEDKPADAKVAVSFVRVSYDILNLPLLTFRFTNAGDKPIAIMKGTINAIDRLGDPIGDGLAATVDERIDVGKSVELTAQWDFADARLVKLLKEQPQNVTLTFKVEKVKFGE